MTNRERNVLQREDNWWDVISNPSQTKFNTITYINREIDEDGIMDLGFKWTIGLGSRINKYERKVLNFLEVTGTVGGIFEIWDIIFGSFIGFAYSYMFKKELK